MTATEEHPKAYLMLEQRPSLVSSLSANASPISFWLILKYKDHSFERLLPEGFMGYGEEDRNIAIAGVAEELRKQLAPILVSEDRKLRLVTP